LHTIKKGNQFISGTLGSQGESDGGKAVDSVKPEKDIVVLLTGQRLGRCNIYHAQERTLSSSMSTAIGYSSEVLSSSAMMYSGFKELEVKLLNFLQANAASVRPTCLPCTSIASA
jgi:hypothetical protein